MIWVIIDESLLLPFARYGPKTSMIEPFVLEGLKGFTRGLFLCIEYVSL